MVLPSYWHHREGTLICLRLLRRPLFMSAELEATSWYAGGEVYNWVGELSKVHLMPMERGLLAVKGRSRKRSATERAALSGMSMTRLTRSCDISLAGAQRCF